MKNFQGRLENLRLQHLVLGRDQSSTNTSNGCWCRYIKGIKITGDFKFETSEEQQFECPTNLFSIARVPNFAEDFAGARPQYWNCKSLIFLTFKTTSDSIQYNAIQYNTIQYNTIQYNTIQYNLNTFPYRDFQGQFAIVQ